MFYVQWYGSVVVVCASPVVERDAYQDSIRKAAAPSRAPGERSKTHESYNGRNLFSKACKALFHGAVFLGIDPIIKYSSFFTRPNR